MASYPGDFDGSLEPSYHPEPDGEPDAGEVVWAWVPYEEDASQGKDRPVLCLGWDGPWVLGLYLTSKDHDRDHEQERRAGRSWVDVGSGGWDSRGRPSEVRLDRVVRIDPTTIRREGAVLERARWDEVMRARDELEPVTAQRRRSGTRGNAPSARTDRRGSLSRLVGYLRGQ